MLSNQYLELLEQVYFPTTFHALNYENDREVLVVTLRALLDLKYVKLQENKEGTFFDIATVDNFENENYYLVITKNGLKASLSA